MTGAGGGDDAVGAAADAADAEEWAEGVGEWPDVITCDQQILTTVLSGYSDTLWNLNFSRTVAGITKWFRVTMEEYLSYLLPKFEDLIPTSLGDIAI